ncbi:MAG TPA: cation:proton antiporter, partial [Alphaproteobacteria bacterium]|nr:cation:proton antiporter [Alphaproteobacteria bacterium]
YWVWLFKEIVVANLNVARLILRPRMPLSPNFFNAPASQKSDLGKVVFANSITLTPGTVAIEVQGDSILVHTLSADFAWGAESCDMDRRVAALEKG